MSKSKFEFTGDKQYNIFNICEHRSSKIKQKEIKSLSGDYPIYGASGEIKKVDYFDVDKEYIAIVKDGAGAGRVMLLPKNSSVISTMMYIIPNNDLIETKYLYYLLKSMNLENLTTGATIPHLYFKNFKNKMVILPSLVVQQNISLLFEKIEIIINSHINLLELYDKTIRGRFVELNKSIINKKYEKLKHNVEEMFIGPFGSSLKKDCFVDKKDAFCVVYEQKHAIQDSINLGFRYVNKEKYEELKRFEVLGGDILVSCRGTVGKTTIIPQNAPLGIMHPSIMKIRLKQEKYNKVYFQFLLNYYFHFVEQKLIGSGIKMGIKARDLGETDFLVPPIKIQNQFADFVRQIDKSKVAVQASLDKTQMLFDSLMQEYFG